MDEQLFAATYETQINNMLALDRSVKSNQELLKTVKEELKALLLQAGMTTLATADYKLSVIGETRSLAIDTKAFKKAEPELYVRVQQDYLKVNSRKSYLKLELIN